jgi:hypothetical protein
MQRGKKERKKKEYLRGEAKRGELRRMGGRIDSCGVDFLHC